MAAPSERVQFYTADGVALRGDYFAVKGDNTPIVIMMQGIGSGDVNFAKILSCTDYS
jgi:hypothetical protein